MNPEKEMRQSLPHKKNYKFLVNQLLFTTTANELQFAAALAYVKTLDTKFRMQMLESTLINSGFAVTTSTSEVDKTFSL